MLFTESVRIAVNALFANKLRSLLTMLGIIIGIASVIAIMTVGNSITTIVNSTMQDLGANNLEMGINQKSVDTETTESGMSFGSGYVRDMTDDDLITRDMLTSFREAYPDDVEYLQEYYHLSYNTDRYLVTIESFASNHLPDIYVTERGAQLQ